MKKTLLASISTFLFMSSTTALAVAPTPLVNDARNPAEPITIKISHVVKGAAPKGLASEEFKKIMESRFPGRLKVEVYHDNSLFKDREEAEALELGAVDVILPTSGKVSGAYDVKEFELFDLPFLFNKQEDILKFTQSPTGEKLLSFFNKKNKNLYAVTFWPNDFRNYIGPKFFKQPDDFKGMTARSESAGAMKTFYESLGVKEAITLAYADLPKAMKKEGEFKVDVAANPNSNTYQSKLFESSKYLTISEHDVNTYVFITNRRWFNSLPEDIKVAFIDTAKKTGIYHFELAQQASQSDLNNLIKAGVQTYKWTQQERGEFKKRAVSTHEGYLKNINQEFLNEVYSVVR